MNREEIFKEDLSFFKNQCSSLPEVKRKEVEAVLLTKDPWKIVLKLEQFKREGLFKSKEFEKRLTEFYGYFC